MNEKEYSEFFIEAIKKSEKALFGVISLDDSFVDEDGLYFRFSYQIDDRIDRMDDDVKQSIQYIIGEDYGVIVSRVDAYPNGYASYRVTIDK